jgi:thioredoxin-like negative regulator of GroEL
MAPIVHGLDAEYSGRVNVVYLDIDDPQNAEIKKELGFRVQPHFVLLDAEGKVIQQWVGPVDEADFVAAFDSLLE